MKKFIFIYFLSFRVMGYKNYLNILITPPDELVEEKIKAAG